MKFFFHRWLKKSEDHYFSSRFQYRSWIFLLFWIVLPFLLWLFHVTSKEKESTSFLKCTTQAVQPLQELYSNPSLYSYQTIWIQGKIVLSRPQCKKIQGERCSPCFRSLWLQQGQWSVQLTGIFRGKLLRCIGTSCKNECPFLPLDGLVRVYGNLLPETQEDFLRFQPVSFCKMAK